MKTTLQSGRDYPATGRTHGSAGRWSSHVHTGTTQGGDLGSLQGGNTLQFRISTLLARPFCTEMEAQNCIWQKSYLYDFKSSSTALPPGKLVDANISPATVTRHGERPAILVPVAACMSASQPPQYSFLNVYSFFPAKMSKLTFWFPPSVLLV